MKTHEELRDYFAAAALQGMLAGNPGAHLMDTATERAYDYADSMLSERSKREPVPAPVQSAQVPASVVKALEMARDRFEGMGSAEQLPGHANYMSKAAMAASARDGALECAAALDDPASVPTAPAPVTLDAETLAKIQELLGRVIKANQGWLSDDIDEELRSAVRALDSMRLAP